MKCFALISAISWLLLIISCKTQSKIIFEKNDPCCKETIVSPSMYLSNRIRDCDMAIKYMDSVVRNGNLYFNTSNEVPNVVEGTFYFFCDSNYIYQNKKYLYYLNIECFKGRTFQDFCQVFCPDLSIDLIKLLEKTSFDREKGVRLYLSSNSNIDMIAEFTKGHLNNIELKLKNIFSN